MEDDFFQQMADPALIVGPDQKVVAFNDAAGRLLGPAGSEDGTLADIAAAIGVTRSQLVEAVEQADDCIIRGVSSSFAITAFPRGALRAVIMRDVTLEQDHAARQAMLDMLRHDMMTPISTAKGVVDLLLNRSDKLSGEQRASLLSALGRAIENVERLARNLRSDARLETPRLEEDFTDIDVIELIEDLKRDLESTAEVRGVRIEARAEADSPTVMRGAYLLIRQALENLVLNAIMYSPAGSSVILSSKREGESVRFEVADAGRGITEEEKAGLFLRFERRRRRDDPPQRGLGLGLSIVKRVADAHGGTIGLESEPGKGSTFSITLPLRPEIASLSSQ